MFFANGFGYGTWVAHLPALKVRLGISDGLLGVALLVASVASTIALPLTGAAIARFGSRRLAIVAGLAASATLVLPFVAPTYPLFACSLFVVGIAYSAMDVTMNAQSIVVARAATAPVMSSFHAMFSIGGIAGAALATALLARFASIPLDGALAAALCFGLCAATCAALALDPPAARMGSKRAIFSAMALLGVVAFLAFMSEGAMADWGGIYVRTLGASVAVGAAVFTIFSIAMAIGRGLGDVFVARFGPRGTVVGGALFAAAALSIALAAGVEWVAFVAFACVGLGIANTIPIIFDTTGRVPGVPSGVGIASVSTLGYAGMLVGPPAIGFTSDAVGLRLALLIVVAVVVAVAAVAARSLPVRRAESG